MDMLFQQGPKYGDSMKTTCCHIDLWTDNKLYSWSFIWPFTKISKISCLEGHDGGGQERATRSRIDIIHTGSEKHTHTHDFDITACGTNLNQPSLKKMLMSKKKPLDFKWHPYGQIIIIPKPKEILGTLPLLFTFDTPFRREFPTNWRWIFQLVQETALEGTCTWQNQNPL